MFVLFLSWDLKYTGLVTNFGPVPLRSMGDHSESLVEVKNIHNEKASMFHEKEEIEVKDSSQEFWCHDQDQWRS